MARLYGSKDKNKRKLRWDQKHKHKHPGNQTGNFQPYVSQRNNKDAPIRIWWWRLDPMQIESLRLWPASARAKVRKRVFRFIGKPMLVDPKMLATDAAICELAIDVLQAEGTYYLMMPSSSRSSHRVSYKKKAVVKIEEAEEGLRAKVTDSAKLNRYWMRHSR